MKILQLLARMDGSGVTRYVIEIKKGLIENGHTVETAMFRTGFKDMDNNGASVTQTIDEYKEIGFDDASVEYINSFDIVVINAIIDRRAEIRDTWIDTVQNRIKVPHKVIVVNDHKPAGFRSYYGDLLKQPDFWLSFDKICIFSFDSLVYKEIRKLIGEQPALDRYMHLEHPYTFSEEIHKSWVPFEDKLRRVTYLGRHAPFKDDHRLVRLHQPFWDHNYELEMRGIKGTINVSITPNLKYAFGEDGKPILETEGPRKGKPKYSFICNTVNATWKRRHGFKPDDEMVFGPRENKIYVFDAYKRETGLKSASYAAFGCDFYHLDNDLCYGNELEYVMFELAEHGTVLLIDHNAANAIHLLDADGHWTKESAAKLGVAVTLKKDGSDVEDCLQKMDTLMNDKEAYDKMREHAYQMFKTNCDPKLIANRFIESIIH